MSDANPHRGEASLSVGGETLVLRPTFTALVAAEQELAVPARGAAVTEASVVGTGQRVLLLGISSGTSWYSSAHSRMNRTRSGATR